MDELLWILAIGLVCGWSGWQVRGWYESNKPKEKHGFAKLGSPENILWLSLQEALRLKIASQEFMISEVKRLKHMEAHLEEWIDQTEQVGFHVCSDPSEQGRLVAKVMREVLKR